MANYTAHITWPALEPDNDGDSADELEEWMEDPFKRRVLYLFYILSDLIKTAVVSLLVTVGMAAAFATTNGFASSEAALFWIAVTLAVVVVLADSILNSPISEISLAATYYIFVAAAYLYFGVKGRHSGKKPDVEEDVFATWIDLFPVFDFLKRKKQKRLF